MLTLHTRRNRMTKTFNLVLLTAQYILLNGKPLDNKSTVAPSPVSPIVIVTKDCHQFCEYLFWSNVGKCQFDGTCLCWWGWTGPNARYIDYGPYAGRIQADYCIEPCHYTQYYKNSQCVDLKKLERHTDIVTSTTAPSASTSTTHNELTDVSTKDKSAKPLCHVLCGYSVWHDTGKCEQDGRCLCWWGWTGPNAEYIESGEFKNRILADYCTDPCEYTHDVQNRRCVGEQYTKQTPDQVASSNTTPCHEFCGVSIWNEVGKCQSDGRCLCWWGWTGPNAEYVDGGEYNNRILADYCIHECHFTHDHKNPKCIEGGYVTERSRDLTSTPSASTINQPKTEMKLSTKSHDYTTSYVAETTNVVEVNSTCHPLCGYSFWHAAGKCQPDGRCLCWWGWTGPNGKYISGGKYNNRILADYCSYQCHFTHDYKNPECVYGYDKVFTTGKPSTTDRFSTTAGTPSTTPSTIPSTTPSTIPSTTEKIKASTTDKYATDYYTTPNSKHIKSNSTKEHMNQTSNSTSCHELCGYLVWHEAGKCQSDGRCLCWWGWTGPNAEYIDGGEYNNRILADYCIYACHFTHDYRNPKCIEDGYVTESSYNLTSTPSASTTDQPKTEIKSSTKSQDYTTSYVKETTKAVKVKSTCHPLCGYSFWHAAGECQPDGRCLCWWGWSGPNAAYVDEYDNRILADYCTHACHYTHDYRNPWCASAVIGDKDHETTASPSQSTINYYQNEQETTAAPRNTVAPLIKDDTTTQSHLHHTSDESNDVTTYLPYPKCDLRCGYLFWSGAGVCQSNGRCLCWWGWTGPNAQYIDGGEGTNRILADYCVTPCHFTHEYRNPNCVTYKVPVTIPPSTTTTAPNTTTSTTTTTPPATTTSTPQTTTTTTTTRKPTTTTTRKPTTTTTPPATTTSIPQTTTTTTRKPTTTTTPPATTTSIPQTTTTTTRKPTTTTTPPATTTSIPQTTTTTTRKPTTTTTATTTTKENTTPRFTIRIHNSPTK